MRMNGRTNMSTTRYSTSSTVEGGCWCSTSCFNLCFSAEMVSFSDYFPSAIFGLHKTVRLTPRLAFERLDNHVKWIGLLQSLKHRIWILKLLCVCKSTHWLSSRCRGCLQRQKISVSYCYIRTPNMAFIRLAELVFEKLLLAFFFLQQVTSLCSFVTKHNMTIKIHFNLWKTNQKQVKSEWWFSKNLHLGESLKCVFLHISTPSIKEGLMSWSPLSLKCLKCNSRVGVPNGHCGH